MKDNTAIELQSPVQETGLESVLKQGAQRLLAQAIEAEVSDLLSEYASRVSANKLAYLVLLSLPCFFNIPRQQCFKFFYRISGSNML